MYIACMHFLWYYFKIIRYLIVALLFSLIILLNACNTPTGTIEVVVGGFVRDVKKIYHYSTCIFTDVECGDLDLK